MALNHGIVLTVRLDISGNEFEGTGGVGNGINSLDRIVKGSGLAV